jgi:hypothetical protein
MRGYVSKFSVTFSSTIWKYSCVTTAIYTISTSIGSHNGDDATKYIPLQLMLLAARSSHVLTTPNTGCSQSSHSLNLKPAMLLSSDSGSGSSAPSRAPCFRIPKLRSSPNWWLGEFGRSKTHTASCVRGGGGVLCNILCSRFYAVRAVHFEMKLYNDQHNAQVFNLFIYLLLPYMFRAFF